MRDLNEERIRVLVNDIYEGENELELHKKELKLKSKKEELKKLIAETVEPNDKGQHLVIVDGLKALVFNRKGRTTFDSKKAKELLHPNTFRAITNIGKPQVVLDTISVVKE